MLVGFVNQKGGVGKSTLACHCAAWLAGHGHRVGFIDADAQESSSIWVSEALPALPIRQAHSMEAIEESVNALRASVDHIVCDGPASIDDETIAIAALADRLVIPICPSVIDLRSLVRLSQLIERVRDERGDGLPQSVIVVNRYRKTRLAAEILEAASTIGPVARCTIGDRIILSDTAGQASTVFRMGYTAKKAAAEMGNLFDEVLRGF